MTNLEDANNADLESFRQQWKAEVTQKKSNQAATRQVQAASTSSKTAKPARRRPSTLAPKPEPGPLSELVKDGYYDEAEFSSEDESKVVHERNKRRTGPLADWQDRELVEEDEMVEKVPETALEHYEKAVERETQGQLGESLKLYQKAFKMDTNVDKIYKNKHFPPSAPKPPPKATASDAKRPTPSKDALNTAHHSSEAATAQPPAVVLPYPELIQSFATLPIARAPPPMEDEPLPPCPISELPEEILLQIMSALAISDFQSFIKLARVCKRLAYLVATEESIWKRICIGPEIGYGGMVYEWKCKVDGTPLEEDISDELAALSLATPPRTPTPSQHPPITSTTTPATEDAAAIAVPTLLPPPLPTITLNSKWTSYAKMFRHRPRIRFNGIYISTCNYVRPGAVAPSRTWGAAIHIVTYYRYLRFFRDGRCLSLLTTHEPSEIVHMFTPDLLERVNVPVKGPGRQGRQRRDRTVISEAKEDPISNTYKGRWKLGGEPGTDSSQEFDEGALSVETEGVYEKYTYRMDFHLKGQERGRSRLLWDGFYAYNKEVDEWNEISMKNEKGFVFSRVKAYGMGG